MVSHVVLPYAWVECVDQDGCRHIVHSDALADTMNASPQEWAETLHGFTVEVRLPREVIVYRNADGRHHREDGPAIEHRNGSLEWWQHGERHRSDGPAVERSNGLREWWVYGKRHREDGPAMELPDGRNSWYRNGVRESVEYG